MATTLVSSGGFVTLAIFPHTLPGCSQPLIEQFTPPVQALRVIVALRPMVLQSSEVKKDFIPQLQSFASEPTTRAKETTLIAYTIRVARIA